jgi:putative ABC transport system permease protein
MCPIYTIILRPLHLISIVMFKNYLKICFRHLMRNPFFTFINCLGLSLGMAVFIILWQYSNRGLQSEHFIPDHENIARICLKASWTDDRINWQESLCGFANARVPARLAREYREIKNFTRIFSQKDFSKHIMHYHDKEIFISYVDEFGIKHSFIESKMVYGDKNLFNFFDLPLIKGNPDNVLRFPNSIVISEKQAKKYFGDNDPVGRNLLLNDSLPLIVSGVFKDLPGNSHLDFDMVMSMERIESALNEFGMLAVPHSYIRMQAGTKTDILTKKINSQLKDFIIKSAWGDWNFGRAELFLQKLDNAPFESFRFDYYKTRSKYIFEILRYASIIILLMAWINYINLSLSANAKRMKELAIRKASGARYSDIIAQFLTEALIINLMSLVMGILLLICAGNSLEKWFQFQTPQFSNISLSIFLILSLVFIAGILCTGVYPAIISLKHSPKNLWHV